MSEILVGIDSTGSADAVAFAEQFAEMTGARLRLAHAFPYDDTPSRAANLAFRDALRDEAETVLASVDVADAPHHAVADVSPPRALHELAAEHEVSLIVVGSTHRGRVGRVLPGSTGERLLHGAPCPVAIVPKGYADAKPPLRAIGVGFDGSEESEAALATASDLARRFRAVLHVIHVFDTNQIGAPAMTTPGWVSLSKETERQQRELLDRRVSEQPADVAVESVFTVGSPNRELATESEAVDLMVIGSRGYGPLHAVMLGGVSHALVRKAACPVLILPRGAKTGLQRLLTAEAAA
jgi:nucleotide-binding universal stress UspA family protein